MNLYGLIICPWLEGRSQRGKTGTTASPSWLYASLNSKQ